MTPQTLASKLILVMKDCGYIQKDQNNSFHKYKYASAAAVLEKVNEALVLHGVATLANTKIVSSEMLSNSKGTQEKFVTVEMDITLIDKDSGETLHMVGLGSGQDVGDKAIAKAQTMALKYAWLTSLNISTGDDPENDHELDERHSISSFWVARFNGLKNEAEFTLARSELADVYKRLSIEEKQRIQEAGDRAKKRLGV